MPLVSTTHNRRHEPLLYDLRFIIVDKMLFWAMRLAPDGAEKIILLKSLHTYMTASATIAEARLRRKATKIL
jgi:hypothetical protein